MTIYTEIMWPAVKVCIGILMCFQFIGSTISMKILHPSVNPLSASDLKSEVKAPTPVKLSGFDGIYIERSVADKQNNIYFIAHLKSDALFIKMYDDGKVYTINTTKSQISQLLVDGEDEFIWTITVDPSNNVFFGTNNGIYKISGEAKI